MKRMIELRLDLNHNHKTPFFPPQTLKTGARTVPAMILRTTPDPDMPLQPATPAPQITAQLLAQLGLSDDNKPIFLNFFRSDCPWCASEMPQIAEIYAAHEKLGAHIIGVAVGSDTPELATRFAREKLLQFPVAADQGGELKSAFAIERVPSIVAINAQGLIERTYEGVTEQLIGILEQTLYALAHDSEPPEYDMIGNGCAP